MNLQTQLQVNAARDFLAAADNPPAQVVDAAARLDAVQSYDGPAAARPVEDIASLAAADVAALLDELVERAARRDAVMAVRAQAAEVAGRALTNAVRANASAYIAAQAGPFDKAVKRFVDAVGALPAGVDGSDAAALVAAGPDAVTAFGKAGEAVADLDRFAAWRDGLAALGLEVPGTLNTVTRYSTFPDLATAEEAARRVRAEAAAHPLGRWRVLHACGGTFTLATLEDQRAHVAALNAASAAEADAQRAARQPRAKVPAPQWDLARMS